MSRFVRVLYSFTAEEEGELSVKAGDLYLLKDDGGDTAAAEGWTLVQTTSAPVRFGFVPSDYLQPVSGVAGAAGAVAHAAPPPSAASAPVPAPAPAPVPAPTPAPAFGYGGSPANAAAHSFLQRLGASPSVQAVAAPSSASASSHSASAYSSFAANPPSASSFSSSQQLLGGAAAPGPNVPSTAEEFGQLFASHEEWFRAATAKRQDVYRQLVGEAGEIARALQESEARSANVIARINELDQLLSDEKARWAAKQSEAEA